MSRSELLPMATATMGARAVRAAEGDPGVLKAAKPADLPVQQPDPLGELALACRRVGPQLRRHHHGA